ncbi:MAG: polyribonucleotide nucleotidyltransferase [Anaerolineales bacterium]|nr:polyribonucleotide nucleotidyltransferase [Anaerolineales bacterium]
MKPESKRYTTTVGSREITVETGKLAAQAGGAVTVRLSDTVIFATATMGGVREGIDFFPLSVDYEERMYATGKIPGSFFRREGRPGTDAILTARLTDRPIRPLFPKGMRNEVQIIMYSLSSDAENPIDVLGITAASAALTISDVPWNGPIAAVRIGRLDGQFIINPTFAELEQSDLDLRLAGSRDAILMVECGAREIPEDVMVAALELGHQSIQPLIALQEKMAAEIGKPKREAIYGKIDEEIHAKVFDYIVPQMHALLEQPLSKDAFNSGMGSLREQTVAELVPAEEIESRGATFRAVNDAFSEAEETVVRDRILNMGKRPDGRASTEIRPIWCEVDLSPRAHGSGLFTRGETQVLTLTTLGTLSEAQEIDALSPVDSKRYMHHYNFPPFSVGEVRPLRGQNRREVGHGALAERALDPVIPKEAEFPYALRLVSEVLASNGSSSMASVCGSTLSLMDAGVPIKAPVAGVAMGLVMEGDKYSVLTDIQGVEDHLGDMDFKVAGTRAGITALQMDIKVSGLSRAIMAQALDQAHQARLAILDEMLAVIAAPRPDLKPHAPRITTVKIPIDKIGALIGPGGKNIRGLQEETKTKIDVEEDGTVYIASTDGIGAEMARERIEALTESPQLGRIYTGKVVRVTDFGAFVEIIPGIDGMCHISQLDSERVNKVEDVCSLGDELTVMVTGIDPMGKIRLSRQAVLDGWTLEEAQERDRPGSGRSGSGGRPSGGRSSGDRDRRGGGRSGGDRGGRR